MAGPGAGANDVFNTVILEAVQVLAIDQRSNDKDTKPKVVNSATVLLSPYDAQKLMLASRLGSLSLTLRNIEDQNFGSTPILTGRDIPGSGFYVAERNAPAPMPVAAAAPAGGGAVPVRRVPSGPSMTIIRGTSSTQYEVNRYGVR